MYTLDFEYPWVIFKIEGELYGLCSKNIMSIFILAKETITSVPNLPDYCRGVLNKRGKLIKLIDIRKVFSMKSTHDEVTEFVEMLNKRKADHVNWITELEVSVKEKREFRLTTDPHACAFGKWYDNFQSSDNLVNTLLKRFDAPHKKIHSIAEIVKQCQSDGDYSKAIEIIEATRQDELKRMIEMFADLIEAYSTSRREIVLQIEHEDKTAGIIVDEVVAVEELLSEGLQPIGARTADPEIFCGVAKRKKNGSPVVIFNEERLFAY